VPFEILSEEPLKLALEKQTLSWNKPDSGLLLTVKLKMVADLNLFEVLRGYNMTHLT
jgi:hypothetical protein